MGIQLTYEQAVNREKDIKDELERLKAKTDKTAEDHAKVRTLLDEFREVHAYRLDQEHDMALAEVRSAIEGAATPAPAAAEAEERGYVERGDGSDRGERCERKHVEFSQRRFRNPWDLSTMRFDAANPGAELRSRAFDAIERMPFVDNERRREVAAKLVERDDEQNPVITRHALYTSSPDYCRAFVKFVRNKGQLGGFTPDELAAYERAMALDPGTAGGYMVPFQLDPTIILTADGSVNQMREIARVVSATGNEWHGITSAGVTGRWKDEATEAIDGSPTVDRPGIPVHSADVFVAASFEVQQDAPNLAAEIAQMIAFEKDSMESVAHVVGNGTNRPRGIVTALANTTVPGVVLTSDQAGTLKSQDVYDLDSALPARWAANASWLAHRTTYNKIRQLDQYGGANLWARLADGRPLDLLGRPNYIAEAMASKFDAVDNYVLVFGDFRNYVIVDRIGTTISYVPHLFGSSGRPTGQSGWYAMFRTGGDSVNDGAFRVLNVPGAGS